jgi:hypothetical protein
MDPPVTRQTGVLIVHAPKTVRRAIGLLREALSCSSSSRGPGPHSASFGGAGASTLPTKTRREQRLPKIRCCGAGDASSPALSGHGLSGTSRRVASARASCSYLPCGQYWRHATQAATTITANKMARLPTSSRRET